MPAENPNMPPGYRRDPNMPMRGLVPFTFASLDLVLPSPARGIILNIEGPVTLVLADGSMGTVTLAKGMIHRMAITQVKQAGTGLLVTGAVLM